MADHPNLHDDQTAEQVRLETFYRTVPTAQLQDYHQALVGAHAAQYIKSAVGRQQRITIITNVLAERGVRVDA